MRRTLCLSLVSCGMLLAGFAANLAQAAPTMIRVTIENLSPEHGTFVTPMWVGFHNGGFDIYDIGAAASPALESLAEDGATAAISGDLTASASGVQQGTIIGPAGVNSPPVIDPGETTSMDFALDSAAATSRYFSYAAMVVPSNDAFIANGDPLAHPIFDAGGSFLGADFIVLGSQVLDAGTEVNDELPANTAFFGQAAPNTGVDQNGTVQLHSGFLPVASGGILADPMFASADFLAPGYQVARITVTQVPEPSTLALAGICGVIAAASARRRRVRT
jgi:PEP-CTERM motif/Spondin_N